MRFRTRTARWECWMRLGMFSSSSGWPPVSIIWTSSSISGLSMFLDDLTSLTIDCMVELLAAGEVSGRRGTSGEELVVVAGLLSAKQTNLACGTALQKASKVAIQPRGAGVMKESGVWSFNRKAPIGESGKNPTRSQRLSLPQNGQNADN